MLFSHIRYIIYSLLLVGINSIAMAKSAEVFNSADGSIVGCNTSQDREEAKTGAYIISAPKVSLLDQHYLKIQIKVEVFQCQKLRDNVYRWQARNPNENIKFEHRYFDLENGDLKTRTIIVEHKKIWLAAIDIDDNLIGSGKIMGTLQTGFHSKIKVKLARVLSKKQFSLMTIGQPINARIGIFIKSLSRYVSDETITEFEEFGNSGLYYVSFAMRSDKGKFELL